MEPGKHPLWQECINTLVMIKKAMVFVQQKCNKNNNWKDVSSPLTSVWTTLQDSDHYQKLSIDEKAILINTTANEAGTTIEQAMNRYDHIVARYGLTNFISRTVVAKMNITNFLTNENSLIPIITIISLSAITLIGASLILRKKEN